MYEIKSGDTFDIIARKQYGSEGEADKIRKANPGVSEPLTKGTIIFVPSLGDDFSNAGQNIPFSDADEVAILIDGKRFRYWTNVKFSRNIDSLDEVQFSTPFDIRIPDFQETFKPFSFKRVTVTIGGDILFIGTMISITPNVGNTGKYVGVSCYSLAGILQDCTMPASSFPLEFNNQGLEDIANTIASPFGIGVEFASEQGAVFKKVAMNPSDKCFDFLAELAKQRNLVMSNTPDGKLLFSKSVSIGNPVAIFRQGTPPLSEIRSQFDPQNYFSHITGIGHTTSEDDVGMQFTVKNPFLTNVLRPMSYTVDDTENSDLKNAVQSKMGRMFGNVASFEITVPTWRDERGNLWKPNTTLKLLAPDAMIYTLYEFIIRSISFEREDNSKVAKMVLVLQGAFSGEIPESLPWDA